MLILASASPRRSEMLKFLGVEFEVHPADVDESLLSGESAEESVCRLARIKAEAIAANFPGRIILAADTIVVYRDEILGKPVDEADARNMLRKLSGNTHQVYSAYAIIAPDFKKNVAVKTDVSFVELSNEEIDWYVKTGEPMDKAGAYGIQGKAAGFVESISGSYTNVVGMPLAEVLRDLKSLGVRGEC